MDISTAYSLSSVIIPYGKRIIVVGKYESSADHSMKSSDANEVDYVNPMRVGCMNSIDTVRSEYVFSLIIFSAVSPSMFAIANSYRDVNSGIPMSQFR